MIELGVFISAQGGDEVHRFVSGKTGWLKGDVAVRNGHTTQQGEGVLPCERMYELVHE